MAEVIPRTNKLPETSYNKKPKPSYKKPGKELTYFEKQRKKKKEDLRDKDKKALESDSWLERNGHSITFVGLFLFTFWVYFRPYELFNGLEFLSPLAFYIAGITLLVYIPTQFVTEGNFTHLSTEVKCILAITLLAFISVPMAKNPGLAWDTINDNFIKAVAMFIVMINVLRTRARLVGMIWISIAIAMYLSYVAIQKSMAGEFAVEGYRVGVDIGGLFGNPNDMALHLLVVVPLTIVLGIASKSYFAKISYFLVTALLVMAVTLTQSRGGFLGLITLSGILVWKLGREYRVKAILITLFCGVVFILASPRRIRKQNTFNF